MVKIINEDEFKADVLSSELPVLVNFFATWCMPCKMIAPSLEAISDEMEGIAKIVKVDVDESLKIAQEYDIRSVPTLIIFKNGAPVDMFAGVMPKDAIAARIKSII